MNGFKKFLLRSNVVDLAVAVIVYFFVVLPVTRLMNRFMPETPPAPTRECPLCLSKVPKAARRCAFCTADLEDAVDAAISRITSTQPAP